MNSASFELDGHGLLFEQLSRALKRAILDGRFATNGRLPATRTLAKTLRISRNTVMAAYELLSAEHLVITRPGSSTRVARGNWQSLTSRSLKRVRPPSRYAARARKLGPLSLKPALPGLKYNLQYGIPMMNAALFQSWRRKLGAATLRAGPVYVPSSGYLPLRAAVCDYLGRRRGIVCAEENVLIVGGTQQALALTARVVLNEGDTAVIEDPHYQLAMHALAAHGARVLSVRTDRDGLVVKEIPPRHVRLIYVTPAHQFPSGAVMSLSRRIELLEFAARNSSWIFEDDYDSEFRYTGRPPPPLRSLDLADRVIFAGSFSKTLFPSVRLGYLVCPAAVRDDIFHAKQLDDLGCAAIDQAALAAFLGARQFERHLHQSVEELRLRRVALLEGLRRNAGDQVDIIDSQAGMHVVVWLRRLSYRQLDRLIELGAAKGLGLHPIHPYYRKKPACPGLLIGFANLSVQMLVEATALFGLCLRELGAH